VRHATAPSTDPADYPFHHDVRVRFAETDAMGIVHHAAYLPYLEEARVEWLERRGHPYPALHAAGSDIAVVEAHVRYVRALRFGDVVRVHVRVPETGRASFAVHYLLTVAGEVAATAVTAHAFVSKDGRPLRVPAWFREAAAAG
jgi:acyl-CoA thioester hydrolase